MWRAEHSWQPAQITTILDSCILYQTSPVTSWKIYWNNTDTPKKLLIKSGIDKKDIRIHGNSKRKSMVQLPLYPSSFMPLSVSRPTTVSQIQLKPTITQEVLCLLLLKALSPLMIMTLPTMIRPMHPIDYLITITIQVLHTIIQFALTIRTILVHAAISMLEALSTNYLNFNHWFTHLITTLFLFPKHGHLTLFMIRKSYLPTTVFFMKTDFLAVVGVMTAIRDTIPATAVNVSTAIWFYLWWENPTYQLLYFV